MAKREISLEEDSAEHAHAVALVGRKVCKKSDKPFKSSLKVNTVCSIIRNPNTNRWGLRFFEDESVVDAHICKEFK